MDPGPSLSRNGFPVHLLLPHYTYISTLGGRRALLYIYLFCFSGSKRADFISAAASRWMAPPPPQKKKTAKRSCRVPTTRRRRWRKRLGVGGVGLSVAGSLTEGAHVHVATPVACFTFSRCITAAPFVCQAAPLFTSSPALLLFLPFFFFLSPSFPHPPGPSTAIYHRGETLCPPQLEKLMNK